MPFFSIVIPTYNRAHQLRAALASIVSQPFEGWEVVVVDDGGEDDTEKVIAEFNDSRIRYFRIENRERGAARNYGLQYARGAYINYFDSDDVFLPCFKRLAQFLEQEAPDVAYGYFQTMLSGKVVGKNFPLRYSSFTTSLLHNNFLACGSVFLKRETANKFLFNEQRSLSSAEDWELWLRVHTRHTFLLWPELIFHQIQHESRSLETISAERIEARDTLFACLAGSQDLVKFYGPAGIALFKADRMTFIALTFAERSDKKKAFYYWKKSFAESPRIVIRRRFWAVLKKLLV